VLLGGAALIVEAGDLLGLHPRVQGQVGDDEAHAGEQLARGPFDPGEDAARFVPGSALILEVLKEPLHFAL